MGKNSSKDIEHIQQAMLERSAIEAPSVEQMPQPASCLAPKPQRAEAEGSDQKVWEQVGQPWPEVVSELADHWPDVELSSLLEATQGDYAALRALLAQKYALSEQEAERHLQDWLARREQGA